MINIPPQSTRMHFKPVTIQRDTNRLIIKNCPANHRLEIESIVEIYNAHISVPFKQYSLAELLFTVLQHKRININTSSRDLAAFSIYLSRLRELAVSEVAYIIAPIRKKPLHVVEWAEMYLSNVPDSTLELINQYLLRQEDNTLRIRNAARYIDEVSKYADNTNAVSDEYYPVSKIDAKKLVGDQQLGRDSSTPLSTSEFFDDKRFDLVRKK